MLARLIIRPPICGSGTQMICGRRSLLIRFSPPSGWAKMPNTRARVRVPLPKSTTMNGQNIMAVTHSKPRRRRCRTDLHTYVDDRLTIADSADTGIRTTLCCKNLWRLYFFARPVVTQGVNAPRALRQISPISSFISTLLMAALKGKTPPPPRRRRLSTGP